MMRLGLIIVGLLLISWRGNIACSERTYFPLTVGNHWDYIDVLPKDNETVRVSWDIIGDTTIGGKDYFTVKYSNLPHPKNITFFRFEKDALYERQPVEEKESVVIPDTDSIGRVYVLTRDSTTMHISVSSAGASLKTPKSSYRKLLCVKQENVTTAKTNYFYFKKGVGLVAVTNDRGELIRYLDSYSVK